MFVNEVWMEEERYGQPLCRWIALWASRSICCPSSWISLLKSSPSVIHKEQSPSAAQHASYCFPTCAQMFPSCVVRSANWKKAVNWSLLSRWTIFLMLSISDRRHPFAFQYFPLQFIDISLFLSTWILHVTKCWRIATVSAARIIRVLFIPL